MSAARDVDTVLVTWGERLFYPGNRIVRPDLPPCLHARATAIRGRIRAVVRRAPQVIIRATGGGKGMASITEHWRYITRGGEFEFEDDRGMVRDGREALRDLADQWRYSGTLVGSEGHRREALNLMLAMRAGTEPERLQQAVRAFAQDELAGHRYVMVLHRHQASPHVHLCVKLESASGERLRPGISDLKRWRETFADRLTEVGIEADATWKHVRGATRAFELPWEMTAREEGRLRKPAPGTRSGPAFEKRCREAVLVWTEIVRALHDSDHPDDQKLAVEATDFLCRTPYIQELTQRSPQVKLVVQQHFEAQRELAVADRSRAPQRSDPELVQRGFERSGPDMER